MRVEFAASKRDARISALRLVPDAANAKRPVVRCLFVVDTSASMGVDAEVKNDDGVRERHGFSLLNITQHACTTAVNALQDGDHVALITFGDIAKLDIGWTVITRQTRQTICTKILATQTDGGTNFVDAIELASRTMGALQLEDLSNLSSHVVFLTDGHATRREHPRGGDGYRDIAKQGYREYNLSPHAYGYTTIGLGYSCNVDVCSKLGDSYLFVSDSGGVGGMIVHLLAHMQCVTRLPHNGNACASNVTLEFPSHKETQVISPKFSTFHESFTVPLGPIIDEQSRTIPVLDADMPPSVMINGQAYPVTRVDGDAWLLAAHTRGVVCQDLVNCDAVSLEKRKIDDPDLRHTITTEAIIGLDPALVNSWGERYAVALGGTGLLQERRTNFRDRALQKFATATDRFETCVLAAERVFMSTPAPSQETHGRVVLGVVPREVVHGTAVAHGDQMYYRSCDSIALSAAPSRAPPTLMPETYMRSGGCVFMGARILMSNGMCCPIETLRPGMKLAVPGPGGDVDTIEAIVRCVSGNETRIAQLSSTLALTPNHPVRLDGCAWIHPKSRVLPALLSKPKVMYNLVMSNRAHVRCVIDVHPTGVVFADVITLGHGIQNDPVASDPWWGTEAVVDFLKKTYPQHYEQSKIIGMESPMQRPNSSRDTFASDLASA